MPRPGAALKEGRIYHVYNRVGGDGMPFRDEDLSKRFVWLLKKGGRTRRVARVCMGVDG